MGYVYVSGRRFHAGVPRFLRVCHGINKGNAFYVPYGSRLSTRRSFLMHHFFVSSGADADGLIRIGGSDYNHLRNVLRMKPGDMVVVSDGSENDWYCLIQCFQDEEAVLAVTEEAEVRELDFGMDLYQGLPKSDKMDLIVQKAVELGVRRIVPVEMKRCVVKLDGKKKEGRLRRWSAISESAAKQCGRGMVPEVGPFVSIADAAGMLGAYDVILVPYENENGMAGTARALDLIKPGMTAAVFIGPEGGFDLSEVELLKAAGARTVSLGKRILRTETAGLVALSWLMLRVELSSAVEKV
jgi:16S rRNA (uracil1498-N3)-methyltransferase